MDIDASTNQNSAEPNLPNESSHDSAPIAQKLDDYLKDDQYGYQAPRHGDIRTGMVVDINEQGVIMDIGFKREGFVPAEDLKRLSEEAQAAVQIGATIPAFVIRTADQEGRPVLSIHQAHMHQDWLDAEALMESGELYEGEVSGSNRGGLIVKFGKIRGFIPASQIVGLPKRMREEQRKQRLTAMIGQRVGLKVIEVDRRRRRLIFSQRRAMRAWQEVQRERVISELTEGETRHGRVTSLTDFGAFVDLGGADGLIHVSELSWRRVDHPREILKVGDEVDVYVLHVDRQKKRIALSLKKLQPDPWTLVDDQYVVGQLIEGRVTRVLDFGAFIALDIGIEGLLHAREMIGTPDLSPADIVKPSETLLIKIVGIDSRRKRLDLSARQVQQGEWEQWVAEHQTAKEDEPAADVEEPTTPEAAVVAADEPVGASVEIAGEPEVPEMSTADVIAAETADEAPFEAEVEATGEPVVPEMSAADVIAAETADEAPFEAEVEATGEPEVPEMSAADVIAVETADEAPFEAEVKATGEPVVPEMSAADVIAAETADEASFEAEVEATGEPVVPEMSAADVIAAETADEASFEAEVEATGEPEVPEMSAADAAADEVAVETTDEVEVEIDETIEAAAAEIIIDEAY